MKQNKIVILAVATALAALLVAGLLFANQEESLTAIPARGSASDQLAVREDFPGVPETNRYVKESAEQIIDRFSTGSGIIFLGFKECPWCQKMAPMINQAAEEGGANIYYLDIRQLSETDPDTYQELMSILVHHLPEDEDGQPRVSTPDISFVRNGEIVGRYTTDTVASMGHTPDTYWTDARKERSLRDFSKFIKEMRKEANNEGI